MRDYYEVLRIHPKSSQDEIKEAYRRLAHKYHPDMEGGDSDRFKEILEAYTILSDPYKRGKYDMEVIFDDILYREVQVGYTNQSKKETKEEQEVKGMGGWGIFLIIAIIIILFTIFHY